ncbi:hypothetical protein BU24DRAFT_426091 [Aaosphaeria arxii CBS 175.79]|uniref:Uncharacterized protein n=1 Tax=Aaosphaeria arxii CBS 175.79 TaxID=1450172 RepID=A0A6A5XH26_9PLEO|nr:uncharacterized protein BU24DRAFT_426091 [Aaosphaeria arxii CBS 175.79]KAF2012243.1 hypothetical protein BU24DRAFT_426091 [Aaosphaeria arxii CBS 175.79]
MSSSTHNIIGSNPTEFTTSTFPDVHENTRVVAVCAVMDINDADHEEDGCLLSDFYLFNVLLHNLTPKQTWLSLLEPQELVSQYTEYTHGNNEDQRVVLNQDIIDQKLFTPVQLLSQYTAVEDYLRILGREASEASQKGEKLLVLIFGRGHETSKTVLFGPLPCPEQDTDESCRPEHPLLLSRVQAAMPEDLQWTIVTNSFWLGGWTVTTNNIPIPDPWAEELDYVDVGSEVLALEEEMEELSQEEIGINEGFIKHAKRLRSELARFTGRHGDMHKVTFPGMIDEWILFFGERSGIPLADIEERFNALPLRPLCFDPTTATPPTKHPEQLPRGRFCTARAARKHVLNLAVEYANSIPGRSSQSGNQGISSRVAILNQGVDTSWEHIGETLAHLEYRLGCTRAATTCLTLCDIPFPYGLACHEYDHNDYIRNRHCQLYRTIGLEMYERGIFQLLPWRGAQGWMFNKPRQYITVALVEQYKLDPRNGQRNLVISLAKLQSVEPLISAQLSESNVRLDALESTH